ncbi:MAG: hypothetical protein IJ197_10450 [Bacteroidaceae bacterium]|nr:hypothetical protein [Bacteroidaceae bacterium]
MRSKRFIPSARRVALVVLMLTSTWAVADRQVNRHLPKDSLTAVAPAWGEAPTIRMMQSAYPVKLTVKGRSLCINSKHEQILPIYRQSGTLYLAMQLTPGVNWLNGLPRGRYRINNRTINIK